jgi:thiamine phosphate synthase YjbQ (UPF0047 family)
MMTLISVSHSQRCNVGSTRNVSHQERRRTGDRLQLLLLPMSSASVVVLMVALVLLLPQLQPSSSAYPTVTALSATSTSTMGGGAGGSRIPPSSTPTTTVSSLSTTITTTTTSCPSYSQPVCVYHDVTVPTSMKGQPPRQCINVEDLTPTIQLLLKESKLQYGTVSIVSRHTTTAITINERESRLAQDMASYFLQLVPPDARSVAAAVPSTSTTASPIDNDLITDSGVGGGSGLNKETLQSGGIGSGSNSGTVGGTGIRYKHNDIHLRPDSEEEAQRCIDNGWDISNPTILQAWRDQEPINAHSHLLSMLLGSSESIPVVQGRMVIGQWQSILLIDLDGPRERTVGIHFMGYQ